MKRYILKLDAVVFAECPVSRKSCFDVDIKQQGNIRPQFFRCDQIKGINQLQVYSPRKTLISGRGIAEPVGNNNVSSS